MAKEGGAKKKRASIFIKLVSTAGTGFYYVIRKNPKRHSEKMECMKFDPVVRKHVLFKEQKFA